jgi:ubiquinol-cytochrome c reductase iron-sulfur subunit
MVEKDEMSAVPMDPNCGDILTVATGATAALGAVSTIWPLIARMSPSASTVAAGAPRVVDLAAIPEGGAIQVFWRGVPVFINHRTAREIAAARADDELIDTQPDAERVKSGHEQWLVVNGTCAHLGCIPAYYEADHGGWFRHCHGSQYDSSGRVRKRPAPKNLALVPTTFLSDTRLQIGSTRQASKEPT